MLPATCSVVPTLKYFGCAIKTDIPRIDLIIKSYMHANSGMTATHIGPAALQHYLWGDALFRGTTSSSSRADASLPRSLHVRPATRGWGGGQFPLWASH